MAMRGTILLLLAAALSLGLCGCQTSSGDKGPRFTPPQQTLNQWRSLTSPSSERPRVFVRGNEIRFYFKREAGVEVFNANWSHVRVPTPGHEVNSAVLRWNQRLTRMPKPESHWREATVIAGTDWRALSTNLLANMTPERPGHAAYYQAFLANGLLYRDSNGVPRLAPLDSQPAGVEVDNRYSTEETLLFLAEHVEQTLSRTHPDESLFLLMAPSADRVTHPLLLDRRRKLCVWLAPAAVIDLTERGLGGAATAEGARALLLECHGLALLKNPFSSLARLADLTFETGVRFLNLRLPPLKTDIPPLNTGAGMDLVDWERWLDRYTGTHPERGSLEMLIDGPAFFPRFRQAIDAATNRIDLLLYIFDRDDIGVEIADQLKRRSSAVDVRVIFDRLGTIGGGASPPATPMPEQFVAPDSIYSYLEQNSKIRVRPFLNPWFSTDHSKVLIIDGATAWLGGMNIGREYLYEWHDLMVEVKGPVVDTLRKDFRRAWAHEGPLGDAGYLAALFTQREVIPHSSTVSNSWIDVRLLPTRTGWKPFSAAVQAALRKAQSHIYLENPYLFDKRTILALVRARLRGVDVRVILPRFNDFKAGGRGNLVIANYLLSHGVRVYFYPGMTHVKALLVDGWACVGSGNLNHLSLRVNQEQNIATSDPDFASKLRQDVFERDFGRAYELHEPVSVDWVDFLSDLLLEGF